MIFRSWGNSCIKMISIAHGLAVNTGDPTALCLHINGNPLQHSCLENPMDRGAWRATIHGVARVRYD